MTSDSKILIRPGIASYPSAVRAGKYYIESSRTRSLCLFIHRKDVIKAQKGCSRLAQSLKPSSSKNNISLLVI